MSSSHPELHPDLVRGLAALEAAADLDPQLLVQAQAGENLFAVTGSENGSVPAVLVAVLERLLRAPGEPPRALILAVGDSRLRSLDAFLGPLARHADLATVTLADGGRPSDPAGGGTLPPLEALRRADVVLASPGALLAAGLDEAEGLLSGLEIVAMEGMEGLVRGRGGQLVRQLLDRLPAGCQSLLFAAKASPAVRTLASEVLGRSGAVPAASAAAESAAEREGGEEPQDGGEAREVCEGAFAVPAALKAELLLELLVRGEVDRGAVFVRTRQRVNRLAEWLGRHGITCERVHGNRSSRQRLEAVSALEAGKVRLLVATELPRQPAEDLPLSVVYLDVPASADDYRSWHQRLSREGAAEGKMVILFAPREENHLRSVERGLGEELPRRELEGFDLQAEMEDPLESGGSTALKAQRKGRGGSKTKGRSRPEDGERPPAERSVSRAEEEEARIRARAEELQTRALEARFNPSRMGIMEWRNDPMPGAGRGGRGRSGGGHPGGGQPGGGQPGGGRPGSRRRSKGKSKGPRRNPRG